MTAEEKLKIIDSLPREITLTRKDRNNHVESFKGDAKGKYFYASYGGYLVTRGRTITEAYLAMAEKLKENK